MPDDQSTPKLHIDTDWKAEAQAEKDRLVAEERSRDRQRKPGESGAGPREMPEASFTTLMGILTSQALFGLGTVQDPQTKGAVVDLDGARLSIDLLQVLQEKTQGNLTDEESREITQVLAELRSRFVQMTQLLAQQAAAGNLRSPAGAAGTAPTSGPAPAP